MPHLYICLLCLDKKTNLIAKTLDTRSDTVSKFIFCWKLRKVALVAHYRKNSLLYNSICSSSYLFYYSCICEFCVQCDREFVLQFWLRVIFSTFVSTIFVSIFSWSYFVSINRWSEFAQKPEQTNAKLMKC